MDTTVRWAGVTVHRHRLAVGPAAPGWDSPAVLGTARATGTLLLITDDPPAPGPLGPGAAVMPLAARGPGAAVLAQAVGADMRAVRAALDPLTVGVPAPAA
ncbi:hypothetical protein [Spirilliplanes yamanashiensis]|uniref:Uncharacterized protein n=1 Tax=Spirilliplanes yamanashiensis TaxID=42233 RepID=A0A8J3YBL9_9ACTN|nr:hypothetical protein [Spirilliplanes yamanashiensis]MDP9818648.1 hypothetical protein [Spirilliplanes yamanashiensis]GIJ05104.1 hypothetical protein Sya03_44560 [Spirilliplanes yamanashiensis]